MCFSIVLELRDETRAQLILFGEKLRLRSVSGHFIAPEELSLPLLSLGECDEGRLVRAKQCLQSARFEPFFLTVAGGGYLDKGRPNPVFCELRKDSGYAKLRKLQRDLLLNLSAKGIKLEPGKFEPRIMLGHRVVWRETGTDIQFPVMEERVDKFVLTKREQIHGRCMNVPVWRKKMANR